MRCLHPSTRETSEMDSKGQITGRYVQRKVWPVYIFVQTIE
jgi:hypothetical protein